MLAALAVTWAVGLAEAQPEAARPREVWIAIRDDGQPGAGTVTDPFDAGTVEKLNALFERFGTEFKPADQLFLDSIREDALADPNLRQAAMANTMENFGYVFLKALEGLFIDRMEQNEEMTAKFMNEKDFQDIVGRHLLKQVYEQIRAQDAAASA